MCANYVCTTTIAQDPNAATSNFQSPGSTATAGYTITTSDTNGYFNVTLTSTDPTALEFANLYFDTTASTPGTGSNLGFEFGPTVANDDAFDPDTSQKYSLAGTGVTAVFSGTQGDYTAQIEIPNTFFLYNPDAMPFTPTSPGDLVSLHLSQSFGYSVVGGSGNFAAPVELGDAPVSVAATPEPSSLVLLGTGITALAGFARRKLFR